MRLLVESPCYSVRAYSAPGQPADSATAYGIARRLTEVGSGPPDSVEVNLALPVPLGVESLDSVGRTQRNGLSPYGELSPPPGHPQVQD